VKLVNELEVGDGERSVESYLAGGRATVACYRLRIKRCMPC
jgi:hypothetical protein